YRRNATVIYPNVNTKRFAPEGEVEYFLVVGRLKPYKRFDIAVSACTKLSLPLVVVGSGPELATLKRIAGPTVRFVGNVSDARLATFYAHARALLFPQEEDFGISAIESMASGRPVIAYHAGGAREYIRDEENGIFFNEQTVEGLSGALKKYTATTFDAQRIRQSSLAFDRAHFQASIKALIIASLREKKK
ncbi:MAG: glycosyltransferase, partial [Candidatus Spechtbacterales bacterium]